MSNAPLHITVVGIAALSFLLGYLIGKGPLAEPMNCEEARAQVMAMQACLANRPQCIITEGPYAFKKYHDARKIDEKCEEDTVSMKWTDVPKELLDGEG